MVSNDLSVQPPEQYQNPPIQTAKRYSGLSIALFTVGLINFIFIISLIIRGFYLSSRGAGSVEPNDPFIVAGGFGIFGGCAVFFWGLVCLIAGRCNPDLKVLFSSLGLALHIALLLGLTGLVILGLLF